MNLPDVKAIIAELAHSDHRCAAIVTENPREVVDTFRRLEPKWGSTILDIKTGHGYSTIRFRANVGANVLYVFSEDTARTAMRGLSLKFVYIDYPLPPSSDFYRELAARTEEIIRA